MLAQHSTRRSISGPEHKHGTPGLLSGAPMLMPLGRLRAPVERRLVGVWHTFVPCAPGQPRDNSCQQGLLAWLLPLTLRAQACALSLHPESHRPPKSAIQETEEPYSPTLLPSPDHGTRRSPPVLPNNPPHSLPQPPKAVSHLRVHSCFAAAAAVITATRSLWSESRLQRMCTHIPSFVLTTGPHPSAAWDEGPG